MRTIYTVLRGALDVAVRDGLLRRNPVAAVRRPGVERKDALHLTTEQAQALLEAIQGDRLRVRWTLSWTSQGLQLGQAPQDRATPLLGHRDARAHRTRHLEEQRTAAGAWQEHGLLVTTEIGTPLEPRNVLRRFQVPHTGVVQDHLGHSSYAITADINSHVGPAQQREAANPLDQALRW